MIHLNDQAVSSLIHFDQPKIEETASNRIKQAIGEKVGFFYLESRESFLLGDKPSIRIATSFELRNQWRTFEGATIEEIIWQIEKAKESQEW